jgi:hypothetical protein
MEVNAIWVLIQLLRDPGLCLVDDGVSVLIWMWPAKHDACPNLPSHTTFQNQIQMVPVYGLMPGVILCGRLIPFFYISTFSVALSALSRFCRVAGKCSEIR